MTFWGRAGEETLAMRLDENHNDQTEANQSDNVKAVSNTFVEMLNSGGGATWQCQEDHESTGSVASGLTERAGNLAKNSTFSDTPGGELSHNGAEKLGEVKETPTIGQLCLGGVVARWWLTELAAELDNSEEVGEEPAPFLEAEEGSDEGSASDAEMGPGQAGSHQLPSGSDSSEAEELLEPVPSLHMRRAAKRKEQIKRGAKGEGAFAGNNWFIRSFIHSFQPREDLSVEGGREGRKEVEWEERKKKKEGRRMGGKEEKEGRVGGKKEKEGREKGRKERKEGRKEGRRVGGRKGRKERKKEGRRKYSETSSHLSLGLTRALGSSSEAKDGWAAVSYKHPLSNQNVDPKRVFPTPLVDAIHWPLDLRLPSGSFTLTHNPPGFQRSQMLASNQRENFIQRSPSLSFLLPLQFISRMRLQNLNSSRNDRRQKQALRRHGEIQRTVSINQTRAGRNLGGLLVQPPPQEGDPTPFQAGGCPVSSQKPPVMKPLQLLVAVSP
ncbi:hypothetical protein L345_04672, partial [Ophiophagus hannah]